MASDPRAALEALLDACDGCGCLGEAHAHRAEQALRRALDECDRADAVVDGYQGPDANLVRGVTWHVRHAITTALEGNHG